MRIARTSVTTVGIRLTTRLNLDQSCTTKQKFFSPFSAAEIIAIFRNMRTLLKSTVTTKVRFSLPSIIIIRQVTNLKKQKQTKWIEINQSQVTNVTF